ncbi:MAG: universal stress protein, partial [Acidobacteria bacterium]|nr:universal stress protein [Acidobacteriota bacterium]
MLRIDAILAPVDFSEASGSTLRCVCALAHCFHSSITLLHVGPPATELRDRLEDVGRRELGETPFAAEVAGGDPARVIVETARSGRFGLIAMATHGYGPFRQLLLGSVTTRVLDETECPVFTGAHLENAAGACHTGFPNVACAVDLGPKSEQVARWAAGFTATVQGRLFLVHAIPSLGAMDADYYRPDGDVGPAHRG